MARGVKKAIDRNRDHAFKLTRCIFPGGFQTTFAAAPAYLPLLAPVGCCVIFQFGLGE